MIEIEFNSFNTMKKMFMYVSVDAQLSFSQALQMNTNTHLDNSHSNRDIHIDNSLQLIKSPDSIHAIINNCFLYFNCFWT